MPVRRLLIGLIGADAQLGAACTAALGDMAMRTIDAAFVANAFDGLDALLLVGQEPLDDAVRFFLPLRQARPRLPVILLTERVSANDAVELIKGGFHDLLELPLSGHALRRKVERAVYGQGMPPFELPWLQRLVGTKTAPDVNRRACFRADVLPTFPASLCVTCAGEEIRLEILDLSVATEGRPGGFRVSIGEDDYARLKVGTWTASTVLPGSFALSGDPAPVPVHFWKVREILLAGLMKGVVHVGFQYQVDGTRHEARVQRYWLDCQRQRAARIREQWGASPVRKG